MIPKKLKKFCEKLDKTAIKCEKYVSITSTLWNTIERCRGFEDIKDEIRSSLEAEVHLKLLIF